MTRRGAPGFRTVVVLLLGAARHRSAGKTRRQQMLRRARGGTGIGGWVALPAGLGLLMACLVHVSAAFDVALFVAAAERVQTGAAPAGTLPDIVALIVVVWWALVLVCQGEGAEIDALRTRHPMWEWLFSHPAAPGAIFLAEMLAPIVANPFFLMAPLFPAVLFGLEYGWWGGMQAAVLAGVPLAIGLACVAKAIEIRVVLRLTSRVRGTVLGLMGWFGFSSTVAIFLLASQMDRVAGPACLWLAPLGKWPWPPIRMLVGQTPAGTMMIWHGIALCAGLSAILVLGAVASSAASVRRGLVGPSCVAPLRGAGPSRFGREPLLRKELLWFRRDGRALIQAILVPLSLAALQVFNFRAFLSRTGSGWTTVCGIAVLLGTYFLLTLGPRSLASEGQALWIAQTWPRGLENLLRTKARLWARIATAIVGLALVYAGWRFPSHLGGVLAVGALWWVFADSLARKTVSLVTMASGPDEVAKPPKGLQWAATLGTFSFAIGVFTQQWSPAVTGVVYSILTAAAMWQNFRHRLPFLADPWSETLPPAPTLLHAMVAISGMVEGVSILSVIAVLIIGRDGLTGPVVAGLYGLCAIAAALAVGHVLQRRGIGLRDIWLWQDRAGEDASGLDPARMVRAAPVVLLGAAAGAGLGLLAHLYLVGLHLWPDIGRVIDESRRKSDALPNWRIAYGVSAVALAPFAEEFLFRGLLYRALDREWDGWRAVAGAGVFFAMYHPWLSWIPVGLLGAMNAVLFKRTGYLAPAVAGHMAYNAVVLAL